MTVEEAKEAFLNHTSVFLDRGGFVISSGHIVNIYNRDGCFYVTFQDDLQCLNDGRGIEICEVGENHLEPRLMTQEETAKVLEKPMRGEKTSTVISLSKEEEAALVEHLKDKMEKCGKNELFGPIFALGYASGFTVALDKLGVKQAEEICTAVLGTKQ